MCKKGYLAFQFKIQIDMSQIGILFLQKLYTHTRNLACTEACNVERNEKVESQFEENITSGSISWMPFEDTTVASKMKLIIVMY